MSERNDGGPAFPGMESPGGGYPGMSLRDYFAAAAMTRFNADYCAGVDLTYEDISERCYRIADALLKAREAQ